MLRLARCSRKRKLFTHHREAPRLEQPWRTYSSTPGPFIGVLDQPRTSSRIIGIRLPNHGRIAIGLSQSSRLSSNAVTSSRLFSTAATAKRSDRKIPSQNVSVTAKGNDQNASLSATTVTLEDRNQQELATRSVGSLLHCHPNCIEWTLDALENLNATYQDNNNARESSGQFSSKSDESTNSKAHPFRHRYHQMYSDSISSFGSWLKTEIIEGKTTITKKTPDAGRSNILDRPSSPELMQQLADVGFSDRNFARQFRTTLNHRLRVQNIQSGISEKEQLAKQLERALPKLEHKLKLRTQAVETNAASDYEVLNHEGLTNDLDIESLSVSSGQQNKIRKSKRRQKLKSKRAQKAIKREIRGLERREQQQSANALGGAKERESHKGKSSTQDQGLLSASLSFVSNMFAPITSIVRMLGNDAEECNRHDGRIIAAKNDKTEIQQSWERNWDDCELEFIKYKQDRVRSDPTIKRLRSNIKSLKKHLASTKSDINSALMESKGKQDRKNKQSKNNDEVAHQQLTQTQFEETDAALQQVLQDLSVNYFAPFVAARHYDRLQQYNQVNTQTDLTRPHEWYPYARLDRRKIIFHGGPTNSGKTYQALQRFIQVSRDHEQRSKGASPSRDLSNRRGGLYVGPLRLLAAEIYDTVTSEGVYCDLITGQEKREVPCATHVSATVEMTPTNTEFDIVVIDEIQMMASSFRGYAWTRALLGVRCKEIHVCGGMEAWPLVKKMIGWCGDEVELREYKRFADLAVQPRSLACEPGEKGSYARVKPGDW
jgi:hypothetical protein